MTDRAHERRLGWLLAGPAFVVMVVVTTYPILNALPVHVRLPPHGSRRPTVHFLRQLHHHPDGPAVLAAVCRHCRHHDRDRHRRVRARVRARAGDAPGAVPAQVAAHLHSHPVRHHHRGVGVRVAVCLHPGLRVRESAVRTGDYNWFGDTLPALFVICLSEIWKTTPFMSLLLLAGLAQIPRTTSRQPRSTGLRHGSDSPKSSCRT